MGGLVEAGHVDPARYAQIGLRGYWPGEAELAWQEAAGIRSHFMSDVRARGIEAVVADVLGQVASGPVYISVDVDALDPSVAPATGTPEPGGMTAADVLWACREVARNVQLVGAEVVEVSPDPGAPRDLTALVADRIVREILTGLALSTCT